MTLTVCVGSSGSGKTTFLNDVAKHHKCTYIRQYHSLRPYVMVSKIPNFDPTQLPYWDIYVNEKKDGSIKIGGTMAGEFTAGLSGGQRKMLLFELIFQRTKSQKGLLIVLDEPFAGVTDDFVPFIVDRLNDMRKTHNILLVTNDHVETLTKLSDNTITVSAVDRSNVKINDREKVDREKALHALSLGQEYVYTATNEDLKFFYETEVANNSGLVAVYVFTIVTYIMYIATFWDSLPENEVLVLIAGGILAYFSIQPYLLTLTDWRIFMNEEAEALLHSSKEMNKTLKTMLTFVNMFVICCVYFGCLNLVIDTLSDFKYFVAIFFDFASLTMPFVAIAIYTNFSLEIVQVAGSLPFLLMIFFSTTFSPSSGVPGIKALRYLFSRFYFWCMLPTVEDSMEGCPENNLLFVILSAFIGLFVFIVCLTIGTIRKKFADQAAMEKKKALMDDSFRALQAELYGEHMLEEFKRNEDNGVDSVDAEEHPKIVGDV